MEQQKAAELRNGTRRSVVACVAKGVTLPLGERFAEAVHGGLRGPQNRSHLSFLMVGTLLHCSAISAGLSSSRKGLLRLDGHPLESIELTLMTDETSTEHPTPPREDTRIEVVGKDSSRFESIWEMYRRHSSTLGFFPEGAMEEAARCGGIYAAVKGMVLAGYLLYRANRTHASIIHLCIDPRFRGCGVAELLIKRLKEDTRDLNSIQLSCREDYASAVRLWKREGFIAEGDRPGRGEDGVRLVTWRFDREGTPPLLAQLRDARIADRRKVAIDANVFFDLGEDGGVADDQSLSLLAPWVEEEVALCVTPELLNEIRRCGDAGKRTKANSRWASFPEIGANQSRFDEILDSVGRFLPPAKNDNDESDRRQLTFAILGGADFFLTRDEDLLAFSEDIRREFAVRVLKPMDLVLTLDQEQNEAAYHAARFGGTPLLDRKVRAEDREQVQTIFQRYSAGETKAQWLARSDALFSHPGRYESRFVTNQAGRPVLLYALDRSEDGVLAVPALRFMGDALAPTLVRRILVEIADIARKEHRSVVRCIDGGPALLRDAFEDAGYRELADGAWVRLVLPVLCRGRDEVLAALAEIPAPFGGFFIDLAGSLAGHELERLFWPLKVAETGIESFIIPIRPEWAKHLFDVRIAETDLFGAKLGPALGLENAYFRAPRPQVPKTAPSRILWYVSGKARVRDVGAIRACSYLDETAVDEAKVLFRRLRHLGIYEWRNILDTAKGDPFGRIMALRFSHTERMDHPVPFVKVQEILRQHQRANNLQSPVRISESCFFELYRHGTGTNGNA
jgi:ribosomal protein S18 acetylase RimI-like enzyme/predicted nucleic acid-binding protein